MSNAIEVRNLVKTYESGAASARALDGIDLDVHPGELMLLMGPSGSGKTTLVSIMGAILRPTSGSVRIQGEEIAALGESALPRVRVNHIGFVFQGFNLFPTLTAGENVELALDLGEYVPGDLLRAALYDGDQVCRKLCAERGMQIGNDGVQLLGGHGFVKEHPVERWYRDLRAVGVMEGGVLV